MMRREFTGRDMLLVLASGFAIVVAVNFYMAGQAASSFSGVVVENSYHASQNFNRWLGEARRGEELGWQARMNRSEDGYLSIAMHGVPEGARLAAELRRPLGEHRSHLLTFSRRDKARFRSDTPLAGGRWIARVTISAGTDNWTFESEVK